MLVLKEKIRDLRSTEPATPQQKILELEYLDLPSFFEPNKIYTPHAYGIDNVHIQMPESVNRQYIFKSPEEEIYPVLWDLMLRIDPWVLNDFMLVALRKRQLTFRSDSAGIIYTVSSRANLWGAFCIYVSIPEMVSSYLPTAIKILGSEAQAMGFMTWENRSKEKAINLISTGVKRYSNLSKTEATNGLVVTTLELDMKNQEERILSVKDFRIWLKQRRRTLRKLAKNSRMSYCS